MKTRVENDDGERQDVTGICDEMNQSENHTTFDTARFPSQQQQENNKKQFQFNRKPCQISRAKQESKNNKKKQQQINQNTWIRENVGVELAIPLCECLHHSVDLLSFSG